MSESVQVKARFGHLTRFVNLQGSVAGCPSPTADTQIALLQPNQRAGVRNCSARDGEEATWTALRIPRGKSFLVVRTGVIHIRRRRPRATPYLAVQPVRSGNSTALAVMVPGGTKMCVNGITAPRVALLREKDELLIRGAFQAAYVTSSSGSQLGHIRAASVGSKCPVCRLRFAENDFVYRCSCGTSIHAHDPSHAEEGPLCADILRMCLDCGSPINLDSPGSFSYLPEELRL